MNLITIQRLCSLYLAAGVLILSACDHRQENRKTPTMTASTPRLQPVFERTKTLCFGRFLVDVPESATIVWGSVALPLGVSVYPNGAEWVDGLALKFVEELTGTKAIYHDHIPLLISVDEVVQPPGKIVVGYAGFDAVDDLRINGYFRLNQTGIVIAARPLQANKTRAIEKMVSIARRLRQRAESEIPTQSGNCLENAFLADDEAQRKDEVLEHIRVGFRLKEFPDAHFSIYVAPPNSENPAGESLEAQWKRIKEDPATPEEKKVLANTKFFRESSRNIHEWKTGYEVLTRSPDEDGSHSHHDFQIRFTGVPHDLLKPYADVQFQTGVADNAAGATKASLNDEEAIAIWDMITSTIRVRPTGPAAVKAATVGPTPRYPLGELAATGRTCPQTGWWEPSEAHDVPGGQRQHIKSGNPMPHVVSVGEPSIWQKLKGERPVYRKAAVWKLVGYGDAPAGAEVTAQHPTVAQVSSTGSASTGSPGSKTEGAKGQGTSPESKG